MAAPQGFTPFSDVIYRPVPEIVPLGGIAPDKPRHKLSGRYLATALNMTVRDGVVAQILGATQRIAPTSTPGASPHAIFEWTLWNNSPITVIATPSSFAYLDKTNSAWTDITNTARTGTYTDPVSFFPIITSSHEQRLISINAGVDPPTWWSGATASTFIVITTAVIGGCATVWKSHFLQGDVRSGTATAAVSARVQWSALQQPTVWSGTTSTGYLDLMDQNATRVLTFVPFKGVLAVYKEEACHGLVYKPAPLYFTQTLLHPQISLLARKAVTPIQNGEVHFALTQEGAVLWDGTSVQPIGRERVDRTLLSRLTWSARDLIWTLWRQETQEVLLGLPVDGSTTPNSLWIYNAAFDAWWETTLSYYTAGYLTKTYASGVPRLVGSRQSTVAMLWMFRSLNDTTASAAISSDFETEMQDYGAVEMKGVFKLAALYGPGSGTAALITVSKAGQENPLATPTFAGAQTITTTGGAEQPHIDFRLTQRYLSYRVTHNVVNETCVIERLIPYLTQRTDARIVRP